MTRVAAGSYVPVPTRFRALTTSRIGSLTALGLACLIWAGAHPETARCQGPSQFELALVSGVPVGEFGTMTGRPAWGASFYAAHLLGGTGVSLGARLTYVRYGSDYGEAPSVYHPSVSGSLTYRHDLLTPHLVVRIQPRPARLTPYLEVGAGIHYFFTRAYSGSGTGSVPVMVGDAIMLIPDDRSHTLHSSVAPSAGVGGGVKLRLFRFGKHDPGTRAPMSLSIDVQGRYVLGGTADYLVSGGLGLGQEPISDVRRSRTDLVFFGLGLSITR